jgi:NitT/TauT family transport system permease protein
MKKLYTLLTFAGVVAIWYVASLNANPLFIPSPVTVWEDLVSLVQDKTIFTHLSYTFARIIIATLVAGIVALVLGLIIRNSRIAKATIYPLVMLLRYIPVTAFYPLLIMWVGIGEEMKIAFLFIACFVYMLPSVVLALDEVNEQLIDTGKTIGMNKLQTITMIQLPATLPSILNGFVMMVGIGWTYCAVVETINAKYGLGYIIHQATARGKTDLVFMSIIVIMIVSFLFDNLCKLAIRMTFKWRYINDDNS